MIAARFRRLTELRRERRGVVGPMVAVLGVSLLMAVGLALDVGLYYSGNRALRAATEAAAMAASMDPTQAQARATDYLTRNGYDASVLKSVEVGFYCANDANKASANGGSRFFPAGALPAECAGSKLGTPNAVRVTTGRTSRQFLTGLFGKASPIPQLAATASAARIDEAGVGITSDILRLSGVTASLVGLVNNILGGLLGITLNLSAPDINALMSGNVDAGKFFDALAKRTGQTGTYAQLMTGTYGMKDIALSAAEAAYTPATASALNTFGSIASNSYRVPFTQNGVPLFGLGVWRNMPVGEADVQPALRAGVNAYQLLIFAAQSGPGVIDASHLVSIAVPGSTVQLAGVANGAMAQPRFSFGPAGEARVATSQVRVKLNLGLADINLLSLGMVQINKVPVLIDIAPASAQVGSISCKNSAEQIKDTVVRVDATSGLVRAYIADIPDTIMNKQMTEIQTLNPATLVDLNVPLLARVTATSKVTAGAVTSVSGPLYFGPGGVGTVGTPTSSGKPASLRNSSQVGATVGSLVNGVAGGLNVKVTLLGGLLDVNLLQNTLVNGLLTGITQPLTGLVGSTVDPILDNLLMALGIQLGDSTVWVTGARCGVPVLM